MIFFKLEQTFGTYQTFTKNNYRVISYLQRLYGEPLDITRVSFHHSNKPYLPDTSMNIPFHETWLLTIGFTFFALIVLYIIYSLFKRFISIFHNTTTKKEKGGCLGCLFKFVVIVFLLVFSFLLIAFAVYIQSFHTFTKEKIIAEIVCEKINNNKLLKFTIIGKEKNYQNYNFNDSFRGDDWFVDGQFLKWNSLGDFLGLPMMYRITRIGGITHDLTDKSESFVKDFANDDVHSIWNLMYGLGRYFPLIENVAPYTIVNAPEKGKVFRIYINSSGFNIKSVDRL